MGHTEAGFAVQKVGQPLQDFIRSHAGIILPHAAAGVLLAKELKERALAVFTDPLIIGSVFIQCNTGANNGCGSHRNRKLIHIDAVGDHGSIILQESVEKLLGFSFHAFHIVQEFTGEQCHGVKIRYIGSFTEIDILPCIDDRFETGSPKLFGIPFFRRGVHHFQSEKEIGFGDGIIFGKTNPKTAVFIEIEFAAGDIVIFIGQRNHGFHKIGAADVPGITAEAGNAEDLTAEDLGSRSRPLIGRETFQCGVFKLGCFQIQITTIS